MLLRTFMWGYSANSWNTKPMSRCDARLNVTSSPSSRIVPDEGSSNPAIIRRNVDLPHPEAPTSTANSPSAMSRSMPRITETSPKRFSTLRTLTAAMATLGLPSRCDCARRQGEDRLTETRDRLLKATHSGRGAPNPVFRPFFSKMSLISRAARFSAFAELNSPMTAWFNLRPMTCSTCGPSW